MASSGGLEIKSGGGSIAGGITLSLSATGSALPSKASFAEHAAGTMLPRAAPIFFIEAHQKEAVTAAANVHSNGETSYSKLQLLCLAWLFDFNFEMWITFQIFFSSTCLIRLLPKVRTS